MIGIQHWDLELGRVDIITKVSFLSSRDYLIHVGHLKAAYQIFKYLYDHNNGGRIIFNSMLVKLPMNHFQQAN